MAVNRSPEIIGHADALRGHMEISFELPRVPTAGRQAVGYFRGDSFRMSSLTRRARLPQAWFTIIHCGE